MTQGKQLVTFILLLICSFTISAQTETEKALKAEKVAFITNKLSLTSEEAKQFWPIYDDYWQKKDAVLNERRAFVEQYGKELDSLSEQELTAYTNQYVNYHKQEADLLIELNVRLKAILPPRKILLLYQANYEFKNYLLQKVKESGKEGKQ
ncbi:MAG: hypothetical protein AB7S54_02030 [Bacteroidales bacterium]